MVLWVVAFFVVGSQTSSAVPSMLGIDSTQLSMCGQALGYFVSDLANLLLTLFIITQSLRQYNFWRMGLFQIRPTKQMAKWVLGACLTFPIIDLLCRASQAWFLQSPDALSARLEQSLTCGDLAANLVYFFVVSVCTPVWEESIFRGFLLSSLTRYMPAVAATVVSSIVFTAAHFSVQRSAYLAILGCVIGYTFVRTRNLLAPILVHSLWNFYVFWRMAVHPHLPPVCI